MDCVVTLGAYYAAGRLIDCAQSPWRLSVSRTPRRTPRRVLALWSVISLPCLDMLIPNTFIAIRCICIALPAWLHAYRLCRLIDSLYENYGIYTLVDAHQDCLNGRLCGEGIPTWAFDKALSLAQFDVNDTKIAFPAPFKFDLPIDPATGKPELAACTNNSFFDYYLTLESEVGR
jgi:hypothetical protein